MAGKNPKATEDRMTRFAGAWETMAPAKSFGGMTLAQFKARIKPSQDARAQLVILANQMTQTTEARDAADVASLDAMDLVVNGVRADPTEGDNGGLYKALGYTPQSERQTGLTRKKKTDPPT